MEEFEQKYLFDKHLLGHNTSSLNVSNTLFSCKYIDRYVLFLEFDLFFSSPYSLIFILFSVVSFKIKTLEKY
jgi:hypothetical protein